MLKLLTRILFLSVFIANFCFSQVNNGKEANISEIEVKYLYSFVKDTTDLSNKLEEVMLLQASPSSSIYFSEAFLQRRKFIESEINQAKSIGTIPEINAGKIARPKVDYSVYRNGGKTFVTSRIGVDIFTFEGEVLKWKTDIKDVKTILGYKCQKAITIFNNREYTAWYTKDIPISDGAYRFKGLPGLILEVGDKNGYDTFKAIGIEKRQTEINPLQKGILVTRDEYLKKREEFKSNPYPGRIMDKSRRDQMEISMKKFNNTLER